MKTQNILPASIIHIDNDYIEQHDEEIIIAKISQETQNNYPGYIQLFTALVPIGEVKQVLTNPGGIGYKVNAWGPLPTPIDNDTYETSFYIRGIGDKEYETITNYWNHHNKSVIVPDNVLLMCYGLVPRILKSGVICWDDPSKPVYDVLRVKSLSTYNTPTHTEAFITIKKDYLEDYLSLKKCCAVATYYEERYSNDESSFNELLNGQDSTEYNLPGKHIILSKVEKKYFKNCNQFTRVWGCRLILMPKEKPILDEKELVLKWPDFENPITPALANSRDYLFKNVYVSDTALIEFENKEEFDIYPETGNVGYNGWWSTVYSNRFGRNHIKLELKKLYEGVPNYIIKHFHSYSVPLDIVKKEKEIYGDKNIAIRVKNFIYSYINLIENLTILCSQLGLYFDSKEIGRYSRNEIERFGLWDDHLIQNLARVAPIELSKNFFIHRCSTIYKFFENIKSSPLKQILFRLTLPREKIKQFGSLRLLGTLVQLCRLAESKGLSLIEDSMDISKEWDESKIIKELKPLFAINKIRTLESHLSSSFEVDFNESLSAFNIDQNEVKNGWGTSLDTIFEVITETINFIDQTIIKASE